MKIISLVENTTNCNLKTAHGLSLFIQTKKHRILFDLGPDDTIFENAKKLKVDLEKIDVAIISHGHSDHGGALEKFLKINKTAAIYIQEKAFDNYYSIVGQESNYIGLKKELIDNPQLRLLHGNLTIDDELSLFVVKDSSMYHSTANDTLYHEDELDDFIHEQNLLIKEKETVLVMGCGHTGLINILRAIENDRPAYCIGGYHLFNPKKQETVSYNILDGISKELDNYQDIKFYTCHCTGEEAYQYLKEKHDNIQYLSCGEMLNI